MVWILSVFTIGYNFSFWIVIGVIRFISEKISSSGKTKEKRFEPLPIKISEVAAIVPAHNEEKSIERTLEALLQVLPQKNIYVVSDNSTDKTIEIIRKLGIRSLDLNPNKGKAHALVYVMREYGLLKAYKAILINDADSIVEPGYLIQALRHFKDDKVAAVSPHGGTKWRKFKLKELFLISYRAKLWSIVQFGMRFGQTWRFTNVSYIIPGAYSIYRTSVLEKLEIDYPGLIIEDFNMTFEVQKKKLGRIVYDPRIKAVHEDPYSFRDYIKQVRRWNVGFWQTVKKNGVWPSLFWLFTASFLIELSLYAVFLLFLPVLIAMFALNSFNPISIPHLYPRLTILDVIFGVLVIDYITTLIAAAVERKPVMALMGLGFIVMRYIDAVIYLWSIPEAFLKSSTGVWESPKRL